MKAESAPDFMLSVSTNPWRNNALSQGESSGNEQMGKRLEESNLWARRIASEISDLGRGHDWAGEYYLGNGLSGDSLAVAPAAGFAFQRSWCGDTEPLIYGRVVEINALLMLSVENAPPTATSFPTMWMPVTWGERHYLIAPESWASFVESVRAGREPRYEIFGEFYLRDGDEHIAVDSALSTPAAYGEAWLRSIHAQAIEVGKSALSPQGRYRTTRLRLDVGKANSVHASMTFFPDGSEDLQQRAIVDEVRDHDCDIVLWQPSTETRALANGTLFSLLPKMTELRSR